MKGQTILNHPNWTGNDRISSSGNLNTENIFTRQITLSRVFRLCARERYRVEILEIN